MLIKVGAIGVKSKELRKEVTSMLFSFSSWFHVIESFHREDEKMAQTIQELEKFLVVVESSIGVDELSSIGIVVRHALQNGKQLVVFAPVENEFDARKRWLQDSFMLFGFEVYNSLEACKKALMC